jgi:aspartokinase-like uncharacterized kinase
MTAAFIRVIKVGGSLFDFTDLRSSLDRFLSHQPPAVNVMITGGGPWASAIRDADVRFHIGETSAHTLCVHALGVTARVFAAIAPQWPLETDWERLLSWARRGNGGQRVRILDPQLFLEQYEASIPGERLPHDWTATSDSIAARVAHVLNASELVLLKSTSIAADASLQQAADEGYVDRFFPRAVSGLYQVRCVNLRDAGLAERSWEVVDCVPR